VIPSKTDVTLRGNIEGERIAMGLDQTGLVHIMSVLTDLYGDPELAVLREYATNAWDSHVEAGVTRPIKINYPTDGDLASPYLRIKDYGTGLNRQDIIDVYSKYGASTKRTTNDQTGSLGVGGKSALTYQDQFSVVGVKDQIRTLISITRDDEDGGSMTVMEESETIEPNGVEVIIPVKRHNAIDEKAKKLFSFWKAGTVLLNGEAPEYVDGMWLTDNILFMEKKGYYDTGNTIVMGNVPYEVPDEVSPFRSEHYKLVAFVEMASVDFPPNRESLQLTKRTKLRLEKLSEEIEVALRPVIQGQVDEAANISDALIVLSMWRQIAPEVIAEITYNGKVIPNKIGFPFEERVQKEADGKLIYDEEGNIAIEKWRKQFLTSRINSLKVGESHKESDIIFRTFLECLQVTGFDPQDFTPAHKRKLEIYARNHGHQVKCFLLTRNGDGPVNAEWMPSRIVKWADIKDIKLERKKAESSPLTPTGLKKGAYDVYIESGNFCAVVDAAELDTTKPLYYFGPREFTNAHQKNSCWHKDHSAKVVEVLRERRDCTIVSLPLNREEKFKRDFPMAKNAKEELIKFFEKNVKAITPDEREAYQLKIGGSSSLLSDLDPAKIDDPELVRVVKLVRKPNIRISRYESFQVIRHMLRLGKAPLDDGRGIKPAILDEYPLLDELGHSGRKHKHVYTYINAAYSQKGK
jgi:hypothetical protein